MSSPTPAPARAKTGAAAVLLLALSLTAAAAAPAAAAKPEELPPPHRQFLEDVLYLITPKERREFLALEHDHQREAFIDRFWRARDPYPDTARNELRDAWYARLEHVRESYRNPNEDRARIYQVQGPPQIGVELDCRVRMWPIEVWRYDRPEGRAGPVYALFVQQRAAGDYRLWRGDQDGMAMLFSEMPSELAAFCERQGRSTGIGDGPFGGDPSGSLGGGGPSLVAGPTGEDISLECAIRNVRNYCGQGGAPVVEALTLAHIADRIGSYSLELSRLEKRPRAREEEWLATFRSYSTDLPEDAAGFAAEPTIDFPRREGGRTVVRVALAVPTEGVTPVELEGRRSYDFSLTGEVLRDGKLFESFRYRFDASEAGAGDRLSLVFQRLLRPGDFRLVLRLEDLHGGGFCRQEIDLAVPDAEELAAAATVGAEGAVGAGAAEDGARPAPVEAARVELTGPAEGPLTGMTRFDARVVGEAARVAFFLDGRRVMAKTRPPYSLELDLGPVPRPHTVRAVALGPDGRRLGADELALNAGAHRFAVRIASPESGEEASGPTDVRVELAVPDGEELDRLELFVGEEPVATLYQEPWLHTLDVPAEPVYLRAVAYLADGASREAVAFVNVTDPVEEMQVRLVEVYAAAVDGTGRPVTDLGRGDFRVVENGVHQEIVRFERVTDRPIHAVLMIDSSASMEERIDAVRHAAAAFLARTLTPKDRAAVVPFADRAVQEVELTGDAADLTVGLAALQAERGTALYDNLISVLYHLNGVQGQRAILLLSDGQDRSSRFTFAEAREFARASGVAIYTIGIGLPRTQIEARRELSQLAAESGGRAFFPHDVAELDAVYAAIESELRSKYLLVYQSTAAGTDFRQVEVQAARPGVEVKAMRGYWP